MDLAAKILTALAHARQAAGPIGADALSAAARRYLHLRTAFERALLAQRHDERRPLDETLRPGSALAVHIAQAPTFLAVRHPRCPLPDLE
nr:hypothetical protein [Spongiactinospora rosea]